MADGHTSEDVREGRFGWNDLKSPEEFYGPNWPEPTDGFPEFGPEGEYQRWLEANPGGDRNLYFAWLEEDEDYLAPPEMLDTPEG